MRRLLVFALAFLWTTTVGVYADKICPAIDRDVVCDDDTDCASIALDCAHFALNQSPVEPKDPGRKGRASETFQLALDHYRHGSFRTSAELLVKVLHHGYLSVEQRRLGQRQLGHALLDYALKEKNEGGAYRTKETEDKIWAAFLSYRAAEQLGDHSADLYTRMAEAELNLGNFDAAVQAAVRANAIDANHSPAFLVRGHAHLENALAQSQPYTADDAAEYDSGTNDGSGADGRPNGKADDSGGEKTTRPLADPQLEYARAAQAYQRAFDSGRDLTLDQKIAGNIGLCWATAHLPRPNLTRPRQSVADAKKKIEHAQKWIGFAEYEISKAEDILASEECTFDCVDPEKLKYEIGRLNGARSSVGQAQSNMEQAEDILAELDLAAARYCQLAEDLAGGPTTGTRIAFGILSEQEGARSEAIDAYLKAWQTDLSCEQCRAGLQRTGYLSTH